VPPSRPKQRSGSSRAAPATPNPTTLARLSIALDARVAGVEVRRDGTAIAAGALGTPVPVDPGTHTVEATQPGKLAWKTTVSIAPGPGVTTVQVPALQDAPQAVAPTAPEPAPFWSTQRIAGVAVAGVGVAGLAVGAALGGVVLSKTSNLRSTGECNADLTVCNATGLPLRQSAQTMAHGSTAALVVGGAALAAGIVVFAVAPSGHAAAPANGVRVTVGPVAGAEMGVLVRGGF
jgi:hypothetical protein